MRKLVKRLASGLAVVLLLAALSGCSFRSHYFGYGHHGDDGYGGGYGGGGYGGGGYGDYGDDVYCD